MKKLLFLVICLFTAGTVCAQNYYYGPRRVHHRPAPKDDFYHASIGIEGGPSIANTVSSYNSNYSTATIIGFHAGLTANIPIIKPLSFEPEVLFSQQGYQASTADGTLIQRNNFISIPLLAKFQLVKGFDFLVGPQFNFPVTSTTTFNDGFNISSESYYTDNTNKSTVAGVLGFSIDLNPNVYIHARYVIDLDSNTLDANSPLPDYRNQVWQFGLGIRFR